MAMSGNLPYVRVAPKGQCGSNVPYARESISTFINENSTPQPHLNCEGGGEEEALVMKEKASAKFDAEGLAVRLDAMADARTKPERMPELVQAVETAHESYPDATAEAFVAAFAEHHRRYEWGDGRRARFALSWLRRPVELAASRPRVADPLDDPSLSNDEWRAVLNDRLSRTPGWVPNGAGAA